MSSGRTGFGFCGHPARSGTKATMKTRQMREVGITRPMKSAPALLAQQKTATRLATVRGTCSIFLE
jgi:hypothetical protein